MTKLIKRYLSLLSLIFSVFTLNTFAWGDGTILTTTSEFNFKQAPGFNADETYSQVWHFKDSTYLVWVDPNYRATITQIKDGKAISAPLDANPDYLVQKDGHHRFSLGVDKLGYVHVTGDMHNYTDMTDRVITPYPTRYQKKKILYWRSNKPEDVTGGFSFRGDSFDTAMKGSGWMMGRFFTDNNGELFYSSHVQAFRSSTNFGQMGVGLYKYNTTNQSWTAIGGYAPVQEPNITYVHTVLFWEYAGFNRTQFQNYQPVFKFDKSNNMYFAMTSNTNSNAVGANALIFAKSEDGGLSWKRANGTAIASLPMRGISGLPSSADIVLDTTANNLEPKPGLNIDKNGKPGVMVQNKWRVWNGTAWSLDTKLNYETMLTANTGYRLPNNDLIFNGTGWNKLLRTSSFDHETVGYDFVGYGQLKSVDDFAVKTYGEIYGVGQTANGESVLKTTITAAPLPTNWKEMDIDTVFLNYKGNAGYLNNRFELTTYGQAIGNQNDSFHFAYKQMRGDGEITAKLTKFALANSASGIMMRETLDPNSKQVSQLLNPNASSPKFAVFQARQTPGAYPLEVKTDNIVAPYWIRLKRTGNTFTGSISQDGVTWKQTHSTTVSMVNDIYVGLASAAGRHRWYMDGATFENVSTPPDICVLNPPTISISPASKTTSGITPVNYIVTITSNDSTGCPQRRFGFSADTTNYYLQRLMEPYNINMVPGQTSESLLTLTPTVGLPIGSYTPSVWTQNGGLAKVNFTYEAQPAVIVKVTSDKPVYDRKPLPFNAIFTVSVLENNELVTNVPITATLTWPSSKTYAAAAAAQESGTNVFKQVISSESQVGIYNFTVTANYKGKSITNNVMFSVR